MMSNSNICEVAFMSKIIYLEKMHLAMLCHATKLNCSCRIMGHKNHGRRKNKDFDLIIHVRSLHRKKNPVIRLSPSY